VQQSWFRNGDHNIKQHWKQTGCWRILANHLTPCPLWIRSNPMKISRIIQIEHRGPHKLWVKFNDGFAGEANLLRLLEGPIFVPLHDPHYFAQGELDRECGTIIWPNGADLAPEAIYEICTESASKAKLLIGTKS